MNIELQDAKQVVRTYQNDFDIAKHADLLDVLTAHSTAQYRWRGMHPFGEQNGAERVVEEFWQPLRGAFRSLQRREAVFFAGQNDVDNGLSCWVCSSGHFMGLFDEPWLGIQPHRKVAMLPYAEFHRVQDGKIAESAMFCDIISIMQQAGQYPLPPQTASSILRPGPLTNDGVQVEPADRAETRQSIDLINKMISDHVELNKSGDDRCPPEYMARCWHKDMAWYGPAGIGSTYTIERYQEQHQYPFREGLKNKNYNGHVARIAEGHYAGFFGWPNLNNQLVGGFMGMPAGAEKSEMRVVDIYRRDGDKLAENWVYIDLLHYFAMQGLDLLERNRRLQGS